MESHKIKATDMDNAKCPVCGEYQMEYFGDICPICGWEHMPTAYIDPDCYVGANRSSLNEYKSWFQDKRNKDPKYNWESDPNKHEFYESRKTYMDE